MPWQNLVGECVGMSVEVMVQNEMGGYPPSRGLFPGTDRSNRIQHKKIRNRKKIRVRTKLVDRGDAFQKEKKKYNIL